MSKECGVRSIYKGMWKGMWCQIDLKGMWERNVGKCQIDLRCEEKTPFSLNGFSQFWEGEPPGEPSAIAGSAEPRPGLMKSRCYWSDSTALGFQHLFHCGADLVLDLSPWFQPRSGGIIKPGVPTPGPLRLHSIPLQIDSFFEPPKGATSSRTRPYFEDGRQAFVQDSVPSATMSPPFGGSENFARAMFLGLTPQAIRCRPFRAQKTTLW